MEPEEAITLFSVIWFLVIFIFFSISRTKLPGYIVPLSAPLAIMVGRLWYGYIYPENDDSAERGLKYSFAFLMILSLFIAAAAGILTPFLTNSEAMLKQFQEPVIWGNGLYYITAVIVMGMSLFLLALWRHRKRVALGVMAGMVTVVSCILFTFVIPVADQYLQSTLRDFSRIVSAQMGTDDKLVVYGLNKPSILFYAQRPATILLSRERDKLTKVIEAPERAFIISRTSGIESLTGQPDFYVLYEKRGYTLATNKPPDKMGNE